MTSLISPTDVTDLLTTALDADVIQDVIDREEGELAAVIGQLAGDRTEVFLLTTDMRWNRIGLRRATEAVAVLDNGVDCTVDVRLLADKRTLLKLVPEPGWAHGYWVGPLEVTYEPNDVLAVTRVLIELVSIGIMAPDANNGLASETTGTYSYTRERTGGRLSSLTPAQKRRALYASLLPRPLPTSVRLRSATIGQRSLLGTARPA